MRKGGFLLSKKIFWQDGDQGTGTREQGKEKKIKERRGVRNEKNEISKK